MGKNSCVALVLKSTLIVGLGACTASDQRLPTENAAPVRANVSTEGGSLSRGHEAESDMFELSRKLPGYGGHFIAEDGALTAWVKQPADFSNARSALRTLAATKGRQIGLGTRQVRVAVRLGDFTYQELSLWRDRVLELGGISGLVMVDLDETYNRITLGVEPSEFSTSSTTIAKRITASGIPAAALRFVPMTAPKISKSRIAPPQTASRLIDYNDELVGGLRYVWYPPGAGSTFLCTIGFTASTSTGQTGFVSASHCSTNMWQTDGTNSLSGQPSNSFEIGYESFDASPGTCPYFWPCDHYRNSDANFNVATGRPVNVGYVAYPILRQYRFPTDTSRLRIQTGYLRVVGVASSIVAGSVIDKIGATTGWIYGVVKETCVDYYVSLGAKLNRCAYLSDALTDGGDSGGPVFFNVWGGDIVAAGIINAESAREWGPTTVFSGWSSLYSDITGSSPAPAWINVLAPVAPSYSAQIMGPSEMKPQNTCYWSVSANFTYTDVEWKVNGNTVGSGPELYYSAGSSFDLQVLVINSGTGAGAGDSRSVTVSSGSSQCVVE